MRFETRREREQRLKRQKRSSIFGMVSAFGVVLILGLVLLNGKRTLAVKNAQYEEKKALLTQQISEEESRTGELEEYRKYIQTKKFVEEMAKNKFGLIYPDEMIFKPSDK
ncbi:MAG: septum formation initiator family protein [Eubacteriales bacterium]|nr:septum formation initiator family protein [Eubacteriales bacterium]